MSLYDFQFLGMLDFSQSQFRIEEEHPIVVGEDIGEEGLAVVLYGNTNTVRVSQGANNGDRFIGFAKRDSLDITHIAIVEDVVVDAVAGTAQLSHFPLVTGQIRGHNVTDGVALTEGNPAVDNQFSIAAATGIVTFHAGEFGDIVRMWYKFVPTIVQVRRLLQERALNRRSNDVIGSITVCRGPGVIYTMQYAAAQVWETVDITTPVRTGASGLLTLAAGGAVVGSVIKAPTVDDPYLGVEIANSLSYGS